MCKPPAGNPRQPRETPAPKSSSKPQELGLLFLPQDEIQRAHNANVETPCLEGRTAAHLGKVRVKHINAGSGAHSPEALRL